MLLLNPSTHTHQSRLASYCRTGQLEPIPGIHRHNIVHYRRLVANVVFDMLQNAYPLAHTLLSAKEWKKAVNEFFASHACQSPQVWYMPREFWQYLVKASHPLLKKYPFLEELLQFEWVEVELFMMEDKPQAAQATGNLRTHRLVLNPEHQLLSFHYPVHRKNAKLITLSDQGAYYVIAHRDSEGEVLFTDGSPALIRMVEYLAQESLSANELFQRFETEYSIQLAAKDKESLIGFFENALQQDLILGYAP